MSCGTIRLLVPTILVWALAMATTAAAIEARKVGRAPPGAIPVQGFFYDSLLHEAAATGDVELVGYLLDRGADIEGRAELDGATPLHLAARRGQTAVVRLLLARGADVSARAVGGVMPLHMAAATGHGVIAEILLTQGVAASAPSSGGTPLHFAALEGHAAMIALLLRHGADIEARGGEFQGTALMTAARNGHKEVAAVLLRLGADVTARDDIGMTALARAREFGQADMVEILRRHGATR